MPQLSATTQTRKDSKTKSYLTWSKLFLIIAVLYTIWVVIVLCGIYFFNLGYRWSFLTIEYWMIGGCILIGLFVCLELIFLIIGYSGKKAPKQQRLTYQGNTLYNFTYPLDVKGGLFSRTYIRLDNNTIIRIRTQMMSADELWNNKKR